jgi:hypothetical protein
MLNPELLTPCDYVGIATQWTKAFSKSKLNGDSEIGVNRRFSRGGDAVETMPACLRTAVEVVYARNIVPYLIPRLRPGSKQIPTTLESEATQHKHGSRNCRMNEIRYRLWP